MKRNLTQKLLGVILTVVMLAGIFPAVSAPAAAIEPPVKGSIPIANKTDLISVARDLSGAYHLTADIDLGEGGWMPLGHNSSNAFTGTFDGQGHVIRNLTITTSREYAGLFGYASGATIKNLRMENTNINIVNTDPLSTVCYAGGICGYMYGSGTITNCYNTGMVSVRVDSARSSSGAGGICGALGGDKGGNFTISNCYNTGNIIATASDSASAGGIIGRADNINKINLNNCYNKGTISSVITSVSGSLNGAYTGGIFGYVSVNKGSAITECYSTGSLFVSSASPATSFMGGIGGHVSEFCTVSACYWNYDAKQTFNNGDVNDTNKKGIGSGTDNTKRYRLDELTKQSSFEGFDFEKTWGFINGINDNNPILLAFYDTGTVAMPVANKPSGPVMIGEEITLVAATPGAKIYYTTNGTTPTAASSEYTSPITITAPTLVKAIAIKDGMVNSQIATFDYTIYVTATPVISQADIIGGKRITLTCATTGAKIYYTTNGTNPTTSSAVYTGPFDITPLAAGTTTVKAIAVRMFMYDSAIASSNIVIEQVAKPTVSLEYIIGGKRVTITSATVGTSIYYTKDSTNPTTSSIYYAGPFDITPTVGGTTTISVIAVKAGMVNSAITYGLVTISQVSAPTIKQTNIDGGKRISMTTSTTGATVYYRTDGADPTITNSAIYTAPFDWTNAGTTTIKAIAGKEGMANSTIGSITVTIEQVATPIIHETNINGGKRITITCATTGVSIYYTTNGTNPTTSSTLYTGAFDRKTAGTVTVKAIAVKAGYTNSAIGSGTVTVTAVAAPTANPPSGAVKEDIKVTLGTSTASAAIYYTTNGATPTTSSTRYTTPITISSAMTIKAIAVRAGWANGGVATFTYTIDEKFFYLRNRYSFSNSSNNFHGKYFVSNDDFRRLTDCVNAIYKKKKADSVMDDLRKMRNEDWHGSCFGISATAMLDKLNEINMKSLVSPAAANLRQLPRPINNSRVESAINYYYLSQNIPFVIDGFTESYGGNLTSKIQSLVNNARNGNLIQLSFRFPKNGKTVGHSIVVIGYEAGAGGSHRLIAYDCNDPDIDTIITIPSNCSSCSIGSYGAVSDIRYTKNFVIYHTIKIFSSDNIQSEGETMNAHISIRAEGTTTVTNKAGQTLIYNASTDAVSGTMAVYSINYIDGVTADGDFGLSKAIFEVDDSDSFTFSNKTKGLDVTVVSEGIYAAASSVKADQVTVIKNEGVSVSGSGTIDFSMHLGLNNDICDMVALKGSAYQKATLKFNAAGAVAQGDFSGNTLLTVFSNDVDIEEINFSTDYKEVLITGQAGKMDVKGSSKGDGNYDASVLDSKNTVKGAIKSYNPKNAATVTLMQNGKAVKTATLSAPPASATQAFEQTFAFDNVAAGTYDLVVAKKGHLKYTITGVVVGGSGLDLTKNANANIKLITLVGGDTDNSGGINIDDLNKVVQNFGKTTGFPTEADINGDGGVNIDDLNIVVSNFGKTNITIAYK